MTGVSSPALDDGWQALANGRARDAAAIFCGRVAALSHPGPEMLTSVLRGWGLSLVDRARIDDGTRVLELAWALYDACRMTMPAEAALSREGCETGLALVRGLLWQNRLSEAGRVLTAVARTAEGADARVSRLRARLSWRSGNAPDAWRALGRGRTMRARSRRAGGRRLRSRAARSGVRRLRRVPDVARDRGAPCPARTRAAAAAAGGDDPARASRRARSSDAAPAREPARRHVSRVVTFRSCCGSASSTSSRVPAGRGRVR